MSTRVEAQILVSARHDSHHLRLGLRVFGQAGSQIIRSLVENLPGCNTVASCLARIGDLEHTGHEIGDAIGSIPLAIGTVALKGNPAQLQRL